MTAPPPAAERQAPLVFVTRAFGWTMLASLAIFLINNQLVITLDWPGLAGLHDESIPALTWLQTAFYLGALVIGVALTRITRHRTLRDDAATISAFSAYLIRGAFWAVFLIGLVDMVISFLRVEELLPAVAGQELATELSRSTFRGAYVHMPLLLAGYLIALFTRGLGFVWLALLIVIAQLVIVLTRFVFSYEQAFQGDLVRFWYAALFLFASAHTLIEETHVRVDVFYASFSDRTKGLVNAIGTLFLGMSMCWVILIVGMDSKAAIINSPLLKFEVSQSGFGMYTKYLMAGFLGVFAITMLIEFVGYLMSAVANFRGEPGGRVVAESTAH